MPENQPKGMALVGAENAVGVFSDIFVISSEKEDADKKGSSMSSLYFFQRVLPISGGTIGTTEIESQIRGQCVARIILAPTGVEKILQSLAENRGYKLVKEEAK